ncbi:MAG: hypothetical protein EBZ77_06475 [Chitinophagia bacterium]|nr:hypothetical protein [Chitinophagia bacterium]
MITYFLFQVTTSNFSAVSRFRWVGGEQSNVNHKLAAIKVPMGGIGFQMKGEDSCGGVMLVVIAVWYSC